MQRIQLLFPTKYLNFAGFFFFIHISLFNTGHLKYNSLNNLKAFDFMKQKPTQISTKYYFFARQYLPWIFANEYYFKEFSLF